MFQVRLVRQNVGEGKHESFILWFIYTIFVNMS